MKTALHSVSYGGAWPGQTILPLEKFIEKAAVFGYDGVMLMAKRPHASPLDLDTDKRKYFRDLLQEKNLQMAMLAGYNDFCGGSDTPDVPYREMQILYITELARLARDLGGDKVRVFTGFEREHLTYDQQWNWCVESLKEAARRVAEFGVTLCVQNHHDIAVHYESFFELLSQIDEPNCKAAFDAWSPALHGTDLVAAAQKLAPFTAHTTIADYVKRPRFAYHPRLVNYEQKLDVVRAVPIGEGFIDYKGFLQIWRDNNFDGFVTYEMCSTLQGGGSEENLDIYARQFIGWMHSQGF